MFKTTDGRKVQAIFTGNVVEVFVDERPNSRYARNVWTLSAGHDDSYYRAIEKRIAENGGTVPDSLRTHS